MMFALTLLAVIMVDIHVAAATDQLNQGNTTGALVIPSVTDGTCDMTTLESKIERLNAVCCFGMRGDAPSCSGLHCGVDCADVLLPLLDTCAPVLGMLFDLNDVDTARDGQAQVLEDLYRACLQIDSEDILRRLKEIQSGHGRCATEDFDGVAETQVSALPCRDMREGCSGGIKAGFVTCAAE